MKANFETQPQSSTMPYKKADTLNELNINPKTSPEIEKTGKGNEKLFGTTHLSPKTYKQVLVKLS